MGQYYQVFTEDANGETIYNRYIIINGEKEYTMAKLTEHSWWGNDFVESFCSTLYNTPKRVAWVGDYADSLGENVNDLSDEQIMKIYHATWDNVVEGIAIDKTEFSLAGKYIVNHSKKIYLNADKYYRNSCSNEGWCLHPIPILTCIGNGLGGGDYTYATSDSTVELIGAWAYDEISIEDAQPIDYMEISVTFKEKY